jgi:MgtC family
MQDWLKAFHGANQPFPAMEIAVKAAVALALGLLVGLEREWSNKDIGARTFAMTALLGLLGAMLSTPLLLLSGVAVLNLIVFANLRGLQAARKLEATTSVALAIIFLLGVLVGQGHLFTPVACSILVAMLLSLKPQLRAFAGGLSQREVRSALLLGLLGFVIWPLLPDRFVDPWQLIQPREDWITVVVIACLGFLNYVLLRIYGSKGNLALRQQLAVLRRRRPQPRFAAPDRLFWVMLRRLWSRWKQSLILVQPETVVRWHRAGFKAYWTWLSRHRTCVGRRCVSKELRELIFRMVAENPTWGAPRIHGELTMLGFDVSE